MITKALVSIFLVFTNLLQDEINLKVSLKTLWDLSDLLTKVQDKQVQLPTSNKR